MKLTSKTKKNPMNSKLRINQCGATMIEFAIAIPLTLAFIFALIEACRLLTLQGILDTAASRTLSYAAIVPGLETADAPVSTDPQFIQAKTAVEHIRKYGEDLPLNTLFTYSTSSWAQLINYGIKDDSVLKHMELSDHPVELILPHSDGEALRQTLNKEPIEIKLHAKVKTYFPFVPTFDLVGHAAGYREPRFNSNSPVGIDCNGNKVSGNVNADLTSCTCPSGAVLVPGSKTECQCLPEDIEACKAQNKKIDSGCNCGSTCPFPQEINSTGKSCVCPADTSEAAKICALENKLFNASQCKCSSGSCHSGTVDLSTNLCLCTESAINTCSSSGKLINKEDCSCGTQCHGLERINKTENTCECPWADLKKKCLDENKPINWGFCSCSDTSCGEFGKLNADFSGCTCDPDIASKCAEKNKGFDSTTCSCTGNEVCRGGQVWDATSRQCVCHVEDKRKSCNEANKTYNDYWCTCGDECKFGATPTLSGGDTVCQCPSCPEGMIAKSYNQGCQCVCPNGGIKITSGDYANTCAPEGCGADLSLCHFVNGNWEKNE